MEDGCKKNNVNDVCQHKQSDNLMQSWVMKIQ